MHWNSCFLILCSPSSSFLYVCVLVSLCVLFFLFLYNPIELLMLATDWDLKEYTFKI